MIVGIDPHTETLLAQSVEQYRQLLQHAENLLTMLNDCDYSKVDSQVITLQQLQTVAGQHDEKLLPLLTADIGIWKENVLYQRRMEYIQSILRLNEVLAPKIRGIMAVLSVELKKMHSGRTALAGYGSQSSGQRGVRGIG